MDTKLDAKLDAKFDGLERRMDQMIGRHQMRLDKHDAELASQRHLLEDLRTEITLLRGGFTGAGPSGSDSLCVSPSAVGLSAMIGPLSPYSRDVRIWVSTVFILISLKTEIARSVKGSKLQEPRAEDAIVELYLVLKILVT